MWINLQEKRVAPHLQMKKALALSAAYHKHEQE